MRHLALALSLAALPLAPLLVSQEATAADKPDIRLLVGSVESGRIAAGLAIDLPEGWKTYWRTPGDAGMPPVFDASTSRGLGPIGVRFPAPERFDEAGLTAIGYTGSVVLPLDVALANPEAPGLLSITVMVGLCHEICVPFETRVEAEIPPNRAVDATARAAIDAAQARVPGPAEATSPHVTMVHREIGSVGPRLVAAVAMPPEGEGRRDVLVEGPGPEWSLPQPERIGRHGTDELWAFDLDGVPKGADLSAVDLRFTLTAGDRAVEQIVRVDVRPPAP